MRIVGLLGGVASGKSTVARQLARLGAGVLDADRAGHEVLRLPHIDRGRAAALGRGGLRAGRAGRSARLGRIVFAAPPAGPPERAYLEQLTHPEIARLLQQEAAGLEAAGVQVAVLDAPLILEAGWDRLCEGWCLSTAPREARLAGRWPAGGVRRNLRPARACRNRWTPSAAGPM